MSSEPFFIFWIARFYQASSLDAPIPPKDYGLASEQSLEFIQKLS